MATGDDGRVIHRGSSTTDWYDLSGWHAVDRLRQHGIDEVRHLQTGAVLDQGQIDVGKRLRPNRRGGKAVLFVEPHATDGRNWQAVRLV